MSGDWLWNSGGRRVGAGALDSINAGVGVQDRMPTFLKRHQVPTLLAAGRDQIEVTRIAGVSVRSVRRTAAEPARHNRSALTDSCVGETREVRLRRELARRPPAGTSRSLPTIRVRVPNMIHDPKSKILKALEGGDGRQRNAQGQVSGNTYEALEAIVEAGEAASVSHLVGKAINLYLVTYLKERLLDLNSSN